MRVRLEFLLVFVVLLSCSNAFGRSEPSKKQSEDVPTFIEAKSAVSDSKRRVIEFTGNVFVTKGNLKIYCDRMIVETDNADRIKKITAFGNVKVLRGDLVVTSEIAHYFPDEEKVIFEGSPKAVKGKDVVTGTRIIYYLKEERSIVEGSGKKVNVIIAPKKKEGD